MLGRLTPISRNSLIDLEDLFELFHKHHRHLLKGTNDVQSPASPTSYPGSDISSPSLKFPQAASALHLHPDPSSHPLVNGSFFDVFEDPYTIHHWRFHEKMLYILWWSFRPTSCTDCGMQDAWMPSRDGEFKCFSCGVNAGSTKTNRVVQQTQQVTANWNVGDSVGVWKSQGMQSDEDEDADDEAPDDLLGNKQKGGIEDSNATASILNIYTMFYQWLQNIPCPPYHPSRSNEDPSKVLSPFDIPKGELLVSVLRAAYDLALLLTLPAVAAGSEKTLTGSVASPVGSALASIKAPSFTPQAEIPRGSALYLALLLNHVLIPFPLYVQGGFGGVKLGGSAVNFSSPSGAGSVLESPTNGSTRANDPSFSSGIALEWVDVEFAATMIGISLSDFFEVTEPPTINHDSVANAKNFSSKYEVGEQCLGNIAAVCQAAGHRVPSVMWDLQQRPRSDELLREVGERRLPRHPSLPCATNGLGKPLMPITVSKEDARNFTMLSLSIEHIGMGVMMALARELDRVSLWSLGVQVALRSENIQRTREEGEKAVHEDANLTQKAWMVAEHYATRLSEWFSSLGVYCIDEPKSSEDQVNQQLKPIYPTLDFYHGDYEAWHNELQVPASVRFHAFVEAQSSARKYITLSLGDPLVAETTTAGDAKAFTAEPIIFTDSPCANVLVYLFHNAFLLPFHALDLADLVVRSGLYDGPHRCHALLEASAVAGNYSVMPLTRRLSPLVSMWISPYLALHSNDRLPFLASLRLLHCALHLSGQGKTAILQQVQRILAKYGSVRYYQFNFFIRVTDQKEKNFIGFYFLSSVLGSVGLATFTCIRTRRRSIVLNRNNRLISLISHNEKERTVKSLNMYFIVGDTPIVAGVETSSTPLVHDVANYGESNRGVTNHLQSWIGAVRMLNLGTSIRRRMKMSTIASRMDALASIRDLLNSSASLLASGEFEVERVPQQGAGSQTVDLRSAAERTKMVSSGGGEGGATEHDLSRTEPFHLGACREEIQKELLALQKHPCFLYGLSDDRVVTLYALVVAFLEFVDAKLRELKGGALPGASDNEETWNGGRGSGKRGRRSHSASHTTQSGAKLSPPEKNRSPQLETPPSTGVVDGASTGGSALHNWVEELRFCENSAFSASVERESDEEGSSAYETSEGVFTAESTPRGKTSPPLRGLRQGKQEGGSGLMGGVKEDDDGLGYATEPFERLPPTTQNKTSPSVTAAHPPPQTTVISRRQARLTLTPIMGAKKSPVLFHITKGAVSPKEPLMLPPATGQAKEPSSSMPFDGSTENVSGKQGNLKRPRYKRRQRLTSEALAALKRRRSLQETIRMRFLSSIPSFSTVLAGEGVKALDALREKLWSAAKADGESVSQVSATPAASAGIQPTSPLKKTRVSPKKAATSPPLGKVKTEEVEAAHRSPRPSLTSLPNSDQPSPTSGLVESFSLFDAGYCRSRLMHLLYFLQEYQEFTRDLEACLPALLEEELARNPMVDDQPLSISPLKNEECPTEKSDSEADEGSDDQKAFTASSTEISRPPARKESGRHRRRRLEQEELRAQLTAKENSTTNS